MGAATGAAAAVGISGPEFILAPHQALLVKQTMRGCLQECMGCEAKSEFKISPMDWGYLESGGLLKEGAMTQADILYALEQSGFCVRLCWRDGRPFLEAPLDSSWPSLWTPCIGGRL